MTRNIRECMHTCAYMHADVCMHMHRYENAYAHGNLLPRVPGRLYARKSAHVRACKHALTRTRMRESVPQAWEEEVI